MTSKKKSSKRHYAKDGSSFRQVVHGLFRPVQWGWSDVNQKSGAFDQVLTQPVFNADGTKVAFGARKGRELWWKVMDVD